jgi:7-carboxy-7-deazaguanine synthase
MVKVKEIYQSVEGEGITLGVPSVFVRFAGCNLGCSWCDTPRALKEEYGTEMTVDEIIEEVTSEQYTKLRRLWTGGEPLIHIDEIKEMTDVLFPHFQQLWIETNGTIDFSELQESNHISMDVKCPSSEVESDLSLVKLLDHNDQLKFVINDQRDLNYAAKVIKKYGPKTNIVFQPCWPEGQNADEYIRKTNWLTATAQALKLEVWIIPQWHKILGVL